jgi:hypothetical protein
MSAAELAEKLHGLGRVLGDSDTYQNDLEALFFEKLENLSGSRGGDGVVAFATLQGIGEQVAAHGDTVGHQDSDSRVGIGH